MSKPKNEDRSAAFYYVCEHQASNSPCPEGCFPKGSKKMSENWQKNYIPPPPVGGITDRASTS